MINGVDEVFTNVNPLYGVINKIFLDFDGAQSLKESQTVYQHLLSYNIPVIPVASGKKGIHLYILFKDREGRDNKEVLLKATYSILIKALGKETKSADPHVLGDIRRLCRVPNTLRPPENMSYCTFLPPGKGFLEMRESDLWWYIKGVHSYHYDLPPPPSFEELIIPEVEKINFNYKIPERKAKPVGGNEFLKRLIRPCLYRHLTMPEPSHHVRVAATVDLLSLDFTPEEIAEMYRKLNWVDWDEEETLYQIRHCLHLKPYSCSTLRRLGIPRVCCVE